MYFEPIPKINYKINNEYNEMQNIVLSVNTADSVYPSSYFDTMVISEQSPEELAYELYNDTQYYWVLLYANNIVDPYEDWVIPSSSLHNYCIGKYGSDDNVIKPHHFIDLISGRVLVGVEHDRQYQNWLDGNLDVNIEVVSNFEYEQDINNKKREVRYVPTNRLITFVDSYENKYKDIK